MLDNDRDICSTPVAYNGEMASVGDAMQRFQQFLLHVWREVCQHLEIGESADRIAQMLADHVPLSRLAMYRLDPATRRLVLVADGPHAAGHAPHASTSVELPDRQVKRLMQWIRTGGISHQGDKRDAPPLPALPGLDPEADVIAASLYGSHESFGLMLVAARKGTRFNDRHLAAVAALQEPLAVALENDRRLQELNQLRERAESESRSLMQKLGRESKDPVIGAETGLRQVMQRVRQITGSDVPVLILGATGTGKELISREIHQGSPRAGGPFIRVNCGAIPPELIDSQLFGHEKGSFTGAVEARPGWFERADGGTLFLDEIGELPLEAQVRFLRVLQDGYLERVGSHESIHVNVRVVAATHRDLAAMVSEGRFREDLWYRIAVFPILVPSLKDRHEDIPALVEHFARKAATKFGLPFVPPTDADVRLLQSYEWPGNIRELGAVIDRAAILGEGRTLEIAASLGSSVNGISRDQATPSGFANPPTRGPTGRIVPLNDAMRAHIESALAATQGRIEGPGGAAALLEINPHTLRARMRKLNVNWRSFRPQIPQADSTST